MLTNFTQSLARKKTSNAKLRFFSNEILYLRLPNTILVWGVSLGELLSNILLFFKNKKCTQDMFKFLLSKLMILINLLNCL